MPSTRRKSEQLASTKLSTPTISAGFWELYSRSLTTFPATKSLNPPTPTASGISRKAMADVPTAVAEAQQWLADAPSPEFSLMVIDAAESSGCASDGSDVNPWIRKMVESWRSTGAGVLCVDHQPKRSEGRPDGPIGSQRKLAAVDGAALAISGMPWTKRKGGKIILTNHKDRDGDLTAPNHQAVAVIVGIWSGEGDARAFGYSIEST